MTSNKKTIKKNKIYKGKAKYCDICGFMGTYGDGKTWNRCFTHLNTEPKPKLGVFTTDTKGKQT